jgi:endo-1,4-beta-xylanase
MDTITRAEFAMILAKAAGVDLTVTRTNGFNDVAAGAWFAPAVAWAKEAGIVSGYKNSDGTYSFRPSDVISRQDMAVMIQNFLPQQNSEGLATTKEAVAFQDEAEIASYAKTAVASMQKAGIISGVQRGQDTFFLPRNTATRAEAAVMIWQALQNK